MVSKTNKIKAKIVENGLTLKEFAKIVNLCETTLRRKINNKSDITIKESLLFKEKLNLTDNEFLDFFFNDNMNLIQK